MSIFQFTPLREGRQVMRCYSGHFDRLFQFTPLREGRPIYCWAVAGGLSFQFTPLREGRLQKVMYFIMLTNIFQFTPLREGRLPLHTFGMPLELISIHAPTRGATCLHSR